MLKICLKYSNFENRWFYYFSQFGFQWLPAKQLRRPVLVSIWMPLTFHIANYTQNFSSPKVRRCRFLATQKCHFRCFLGLKPFSRPNGRLLPIACHTYLESYSTQLYFGLSGNHFSASYKASDFCWQIRLYFLEHLRMSHIETNLKHFEGNFFGMPWKYILISMTCPA